MKRFLIIIFLILAINNIASGFTNYKYIPFNLVDKSQLTYETEPKNYHEKLLWGYMDYNGYIIISAKFQDAKLFNTSGFAPVKKDEKWGIINETGKFVVKPEYDFIDIVDNECFLVKKDGKYGYLKNNGGILVSPQFDEVFSFHESEYAIFKKNNKYGFIDKQGKIVINPIYDHVMSFKKNDLTLVKNNNKYGYINKKGKIIIPLQYDKAEIFVDDRAIVYVNSKYGIIDKSGKYIVKPNYDNITSYRSGLAGVQSGGKWGFVNKSGKIVLPIKFYGSHLSFSHDGYAVVEDAYGNPYIIDAKGNQVFKNLTKGAIMIINFYLGRAYILYEKDQNILIDTKGKILIKNAVYEVWPDTYKALKYDYLISKEVALTPVKLSGEYMSHHKYHRFIIKEELIQFFYRNGEIEYFDMKRGVFIIPKFKDDRYL